MQNNVSKKYFIKDSSLHCVDDDMFNYADISKVLGKIIDTNKPPYNVAIIGKWGLGKSSLINLVTNVYKNKGDEYLVQEINAWKYEKESLGKVFLKQLWQGISGKKVKSFEVIKREFSEIINGDIDATPSKSKKVVSKKLLLTAGAITLATIVTFVIYKFIQAMILGTNIDLKFFGNMFLSYCKNIATVLLFPVLIGFCKVLLDDYHARDTKKIELSFPIETTDDYEIFLEEKIKEYLEKVPNLKVITIIDDLDRLSIDKIVEALDALKAFVGFDRCIFIVPFDDEIIKLALDKRRARIFNDKDDIVESELILDKLFQFKIYLPPLLNFDIKKYAFELVKQEIPDFLTDFCDQKTMQKLLERVIIHSDVSTPRQVKKLINAFINNYMVAYEREESKKVQNGLLTSETGRTQIAKFSVLQADFNKFYDLLFKDINSINKILEYHRNPIEYKDMPEYLMDYFERPKGADVNNKSVIKPEFEPLINFLTRTEKYKVDSVAPYLYLAQDDISKKTGDEIQRRVVNALTSGNIESVRQLISANPDVADALIYQLTLDNDELSDVIATSLSVFQNVSDAHKAPLAQNIIERTLELTEPDTEFLYNIDPEDIFATANYSDNENFANDFLRVYLHVFTRDEWLQTQNILEALNSFIEHYSELNAEQLEILKSIAIKCIGSDKIATKDLIPIIPTDNINAFLTLFGVEWYKKICHYTNAESDFSELSMANIVYSFRQLKNFTNINILIDSIIPLTTYAAFLPTLNIILDETATFSTENTEIAELSVRKGMASNYATQIAKNLVELDFAKNIEKIHYAINGMNYRISEENKNSFDSFTNNFSKSSLVDDILEYCGRNSYFEFLSDTVDDLGKTVLDAGDSDELFKRVQYYYTEEQRTAFLEKLKTISVYANKSYDREISIYAIVALNNDNEDFLDGLVCNTLIPQLKSYHGQPVYFEFISQVMGNIKNAISQESIDIYVKELITRFNNYSTSYLAAINRIPGKMSQNVFKALFAHLLSVTTTDFDMALNIIINNNNLRPKEDKDLTDYRNFLVGNLETASNPNKVIDAISNSFANISNPQEMIENGLSNVNTDRSKLTSVLGKFLNADGKNIERVSKEIITIISLEDAKDIVFDSIKMIKRHSIADILSTITQQIDENASLDSLLNLMDLSEQHVSSASAISLLFKSLELAFSHINQTDSILTVIRKINHFKANILSRKVELATILHNGFHETTSNQIKESILHLVSSLKIRPQFKKLLDEDDLKYYKNWAE